MVETRCGCLCSQCEYKEKMNCGGCIETNGKPFHQTEGICPVAACCESKGYVHCGECPDIPCQLLKEFSYDKEQGDNGKRIEQCRKWYAAGESR